MSTMLTNGKISLAIIWVIVVLIVDLYIILYGRYVPVKCSMIFYPTTIHVRWEFMTHGRSDCMKINTCKHKFSSMSSVYSSIVNFLVIMYLPKITSLFAQRVILLYVPNVRNIGFVCVLLLWGILGNVRCQGLQYLLIHSKKLQTLVHITRKPSMYIKKVPLLC